MPPRVPPEYDADSDIQTILSVARGVAGTLNRAEILTRVQRRVAEALRCEIVVTFYRDPSSDAFRIVARHGVPAEFESFIPALTFPHGEPFGGRSTAGETVLVSDLEAWPSLPPATAYSRPSTSWTTR